MIKKLVSLFLLSFSTIFGFAQQEEQPQEYVPYRQDLDDSSSVAKARLKRAEHILATLVPDPESYHLILSNNHTFGGEAVPPYFHSDKPTLIIYQGALAPARTDEEVAFMMAHEIGHLQLHHHEEMGQQMEKIFTTHPIAISGITYTTYFQKMQERQADLFGLDLYSHAGYDLNFFSHTLGLIKINPNIHFGTNKPFRKELSSLSYFNSHFGIKDRFELLVEEAQYYV